MTEKDALLISAAAKSIVFFVRRILRAKPTKQQMAVLVAIDEGAKKIAIKSGHGSGKSTLMSWIILWALSFKEDCKVPMTAPSAPQLTEILIPEVRKWWNSLPPILKDRIVVQTEKVVNVETDAFAIARTARRENPDALQGFHATNLYFLIDEASGVPIAIYEVVEGALTGEHSFAMLTGNPTKTDGYFYDAFHKNAWQWTRFTFNTEESENVSKEAIEQYRRKYGEDSDVYRVRVLGEFPRATSNAVFTVAEIEDAIARPLNEVDTSGAEVWALDVADEGDDTSVLVKRKGKHFHSIRRFRNFNQEQLKGMLLLEYSKAKIKPKYIFVDAVGVGAGLVSACHNVGLDMVIGVKASYNAIEKEIYYRKRAEWFFKLKYILPDAKIPNDDEMVGELGSITYYYTEKQEMAITKKREIKNKLGRSPDVADAMAMSCEEFFYVQDEYDDEYDEYATAIYGDDKTARTYGGAAWG